MAIDLGNDPGGTEPTTAEKLQIRSAIGVGTTDAPTFLAQTLTGQSLTGTQATSLVDLATTWLSTTGTPTAIKLNVTDTASNAASKLMDIQRNGVSQFQIIKNTAAYSAAEYDGNVVTGYYIGSRSYWNAKMAMMVMGSQGSYNWSTNGVPTPNSETVGLSLFQDATGILAQRNGSAIQTLRIYNTYTDVNNFSRLKIGYEVANYAAFVIAGEQLGSGGGRNLALSGGGNVFGIGTAANGNFNWVINGGHLLAGTDNLHDIGAIGANRPKNVYAGSSLFTGSGIGVGIYHPTFGGLAFQSSGVVTVYGGAGYTTFDRLQIGGTTSAFPAIKRNATGIDIRLADDSAFAPLSCGPFVANGNLRSTDTAQIGWLNTRSAMISPADGVIRLTNNAGTSYTRLELGEADMGIMRGAGTPENIVTAKVGSIYLRTDGTSGSSFYVKESGSGPNGWVAK